MIVTLTHFDIRYRLNIGDKKFNEEIIESVEKIITLILK